MAQRTIDMTIINTVIKYIKTVSKVYNVKAVYLFGSFAKGTNHEDSDIDIAIISDDFKDKIDDMSNLFMLTRNIDLRIEPHPFSTEDFEDDPFANEIIETGIKVA